MQQGLEAATPGCGPDHLHVPRRWLYISPHATDQETGDKVIDTFTAMTYIEKQ